MSLKNLKRGKAPSLSDLVQRAEDADKSARPTKDERFWTPTRDAAGNGYAVIRFLPDTRGVAWERYWDHGFQGPTGQWYIEKSLTSIGKPDPVSELNVELYNSGREEDKKTVSKQKRKLHYVSNIVVLADPKNPENEGKVFLFRYGKKIHDMIMTAMKPEFPDETPTNPFDPWEGADFVMKIRMQDKYPNYDASSFKNQSELFDGDEANLEEVDKSLVSLAEFVDPAEYKSYDELKARLNLVLGRQPAASRREATAPEQPADPVGREAAGRTPDTAENSSLGDGESSALERDDDIMAELARLANED